MTFFHIFVVILAGTACVRLCAVEANRAEFITAGQEEEPITSGACGPNVNWTFDNATHTLSLSGSGGMFYYFYSHNVPWYNLSSEIERIEMSENITYIGNYAFDGCSSLTSIKIPENVNSIGSYAFYKCSKLTSINIPDKVTRIEDGTFQGCSSLTTIKIPENVTSIGSGAFYECSNLTSINIHDKVTMIEDYTFYGCSSLKTI